MKLQPGITPKLTFIFVGFAALLLAGVASLAYTNGRNALRQAAISELQSVATEKESALIEWERDKQSAMQTIASLPELQQDMIAFRSAPPGSPEAQAAYDRLVDQLRPWAGDGKDFQGLLIMNPDTAEVIAATRADEEGKFKENFPYFIHGREGGYFQSAYYSPELQSVAMTVSTPVKSADGRLLGVLAGRLNLEQLNAIIQRRSGLHQTDDAFLVSASNLFVTQPRFISDPAVLRRGIHTEAVKQCLLHEDGALAYQDYRGKSVLGIYRWLPEFDVCLVAKLDQAEALASSHAFGQTVLLLSLAMLVVASVLALGLARTIVQPLQSLQSGVVRFGQGQLDARLPETSRDELGVLAHEFNQMAASLADKDAQLREYTLRLEQKVDERTTALRESESLKASILQSALDCIVTIDHQGRIMEFNPAAQETFGYSLDEVLGKEMADLIIPPKLRDQHRRGLQRYLAAGETNILGKRLELTGMRADGGEFPVELTIQRVTDSEPPIFTGFLRDITERKRAEEDLRKLNEELEERVTQRTAELEAANRELEAFSYSVSHDLRAPLRTIDGFSQAVMEDYGAQLSEQGRSDLMRVRKATQHMAALIDDLLKLARVTRAVMNPASVDLSKIADIIAKELQNTQPERKVKFTIAPKLTARGDEPLLRIALQNLLNNAWKYTSKREQAEIEFGSKREGNGTIYFIRDNGAGFEMVYVDKLFGAFQRLHAMTDFPGTGIGLATVQRILLRHGGRIWAEAEVDRGATFFFTLPTAERASPKVVQREKDSIAKRAEQII